MKGKHSPERAMDSIAKDRDHGAKDMLAQFDLDGDGTISDTEKASAGDRYDRVMKAMETREEGAQHHADRIAQRDDMKADKAAIREAGPEAKREAMAAVKEDKKAMKEAVKSGEMTKEEAKAAKKEKRRWWQL